jgi:beta-phosphoglucomutase-like phosphatase (HAD superfamily)
VIVSNNSDAAIRDYLDIHGIEVLAVIGRPYGEPGRMKPNPELVLCAVEAVDVAPEECVFIGDAVTDVEAARSAGVHSIAYANSPDRILALVDAGAEAIVESMAAIAHGLDLR